MELMAGIRSELSGGGRNRSAIGVSGEPQQLPGWKGEGEELLATVLVGRSRRDLTGAAFGWGGHNNCLWAPGLLLGHS